MIARPLSRFLLTLVAFVLLATPFAQLAQASSLPAITLWNNFSPGDNAWIGSLPTTVSIEAGNSAGLNAASAAYQLSANGGASWSAWLTENLHTEGSATVLTLIVNGPALVEGANRIRFRINDSLASESVSPAYTLNLDTTPPGSPINPTPVPSNWNNANSFGATWTNPADASGISGVWYRVGAAPNAANDGTFVAGAGIASLSNVTVPADGTYNLWLWLADGLGHANHSTAVSVPLRLDTVAPGVPANLVVTPAGWVTNDNGFDVTWVNPADMSGIVAAWYKLGSEPTNNQDGVRVAGDNINQITDIAAPAPGSYHLFVWLEDAAGNIDRRNRNVALDAIKWDPASPQLFLDPFGTPGDNGWYLSPVEVSIIASDTGSGVDAVEYKLDAGSWSEGRFLTITNDGQHQLQARASDIAGNQTTTGTESIPIDQVPPATSATLDRSPLIGDWYEDTVTVTFAPTDATSGVSRLSWRLDDGPEQNTLTAVISSEGEHQLSYQARDVAGNVETLITRTINIDRSAPVTAYVILPVGSSNGWYNTPVTVTLVPTDAGSGVANTYYRINEGAWQSGTGFTLSASGEYSVEFYSVDELGHIERTFRIPGGIRIDTDAPLAPIPIDTQPQTWSRQNGFDLTLATPPDLSGITGLYYKLGAAPTGPTDGIWRPGSASVIEDVQAPNQGEFKAYVWLKDAAGNIDHSEYGLWQGTLSLKYDATPPTTSAKLEGDEGDNDWFISPVQVTLLPGDALSGVVSTTVSIDGADPISDTVFALTEPDKHTLQFQSTDAAGNVEQTQLLTVRIDPDAPASPADVVASPGGWSRNNRFALAWENPTDVSGIAGGYYKIGAAPTGPYDGTLTPAGGAASDIEVPGEGAWDLHFWLVDRAGNADPTSRVTLPSALRYDNSPPLTNIAIVDGTLGKANWYTTPVTLLLTSTDAASGVATVRVRLDGGAWESIEPGSSLKIETTGRHLIEYQATDVAGNVEPRRQINLWVDLAAPRPHFKAIDRYQRQTSFVLNWGSADEPDGSGLDGYDLQVKDGRNGAWSAWGATNVPDESGRYYGAYGHRYFFRMRVRDQAGNLSPWQELGWGVYVDRVVNGDFASGGFGAWTNGGVLPRQILSVSGPDGANVNAVRLGNPNYGPNVPGVDIPPDNPGKIPVGSGAISQTIRIPGPDILDHATIGLWYRIYTYDTAYGSSQQRWFDTLDVRLTSPGGDWIALRDGLPFEQWQEGKLADLGWRYASAEIPSTWLGENATLSIQSWNRVDGRLNTYSFATDIRIWEPYRQYFPAVTTQRSANLSAASAPPRPAEAPLPTENARGLR